MDKVVVSLGGSVLIPDDDDVQFLKEIADLLSRMNEKVGIIAVCGGGRIARYYIQGGRDLGASVDQLDEMGIQVTRLNARLLQLALGEICVDALPMTSEEAAALQVQGKIVVMGGTEPGHTTDAVAAMVAREWKADRIVNATSVDAVYSDDPKVVKDARRYTWLSFDDFLRIVDGGDHDAGPTTVFDRKGARIAKEEGIPVYIVNGRDLDELEEAIRGGEIRGTKVI
jgi:uridylate kinase